MSGIWHLDYIGTLVPHLRSGNLIVAAPCLCELDLIIRLYQFLRSAVGMEQFAGNISN